MIIQRNCFGHELSIEWVSVADFWCKTHSATSPIDLDGFGGDPGGPKNPESLVFAAVGGLCWANFAPPTVSVLL